MNDTYSWNVCDDILKENHILIAGTTGSGKSVMLNSMVFSAITSSHLFYFIDLKRVELRRYRDMVSTLGVATEPEQVIPLLDRAISQMEHRYSHMKGVKSTDSHIFIVIDELADLSTIKGVEERLIKIGRLGRAANIHLLCATQDPSRKTLKASLMQNFTCCVALRCRSSIESRQIIGVKGAELLPKYGHGIEWNADGISKIKIPFTPDEDIDYLVSKFARTPLQRLLNRLQLI